MHPTKYIVGCVIQRRSRHLPLSLVLNLKMSLASDHPSLFLDCIMTSYSVEAVRP